MNTNQTIDGVPREAVAALEKARDVLRAIIIGKVAGAHYASAQAVCHQISHVLELFGLLDAESAPCAKSQVEGKRERFQRWVMATKHPVYGFLDGRSLARDDDRTGYADEYVQGLWVAYLEFGAAQPQGVPVALTAAGILRDDGDGGLAPEWILEGGTAELWAGAVLLIADEDQELCADDGHCELYRDPPEQPAPVAVDVLSTGFYVTESGGGKYAINIGFRSMADMQAADAQLRELLKSP